MTSFSTFVLDTLQAAPFLTFVSFILIYILLGPTIITLVFRLSGLAPTTDESQRTCPTCDGSGVVDVTMQDKSSQTEVH
ncbi:hypothetical protein N7537_007141 [Penicillium hordei]|uniref:Uncharacterized protein n=1 Tax=Penicillium hordei TaxID=40994 RepID=A0AAD6E8U4_9EURO|nr:uncharacterized protein N7537_007141 [Penicillium hordei]KAJ5604185.1 hypothetical protein N7537_007141 [Penicillium hordei]